MPVKKRVAKIGSVLRAGLKQLLRKKPPVEFDFNPSFLARTDKNQGVRLAKLAVEKALNKTFPKEVDAKLRNKLKSLMQKRAKLCFTTVRSKNHCNQLLHQIKRIDVKVTGLLSNSFGRKAATDFAKHLADYSKKLAKKLEP